VTAAQHGLDFIDFQNPKVRRPLMGFEQRIVIGTEMSGHGLPVTGRIEHAADVGAGDGLRQLSRGGCLAEPDSLVCPSDRHQRIMGTVRS
jgi:hypothetical protein